MDTNKRATTTRDRRPPPKTPVCTGVALAKDVIDGRSKALIGDSVWIVECEDDLKKGDKVKIPGLENGMIPKAEKA